MADTRPSRKEPKKSKLSQQQLSAFRPVVKPTTVVLIYLLVGIILIPIGTVCLRAAMQVEEIRQRYDNHEGCLPDGKNHDERVREMQRFDRNGTCQTRFQVPMDMKGPVYVYYELENYFQNHRRYVKSRSDEQLIGESGGDKSNCKPKLYQTTENNSETERMINPCGLTAWSYFNDTFQIKREGSDPIYVDEKGIAWKSDIEYNFGDYEPQNFNNKPGLRGGAQIKGKVSEDEHFIVWMRNAALPRFRKLYGVIHESILEGDILTITIGNYYNTYLFGGTKTVILSTTSWAGGKDYFLGYLFVTLGCLFVCTGCFFFWLHFQFPRDFGDHRYLSWRRKDL